MLETLRQRFPWLESLPTTGVVAEEQPENGTEMGCPAVRLGNDVLWFWDKEARPRNRDGAIMKAKAPTGHRSVLCFDAAHDQAELLMVEGEADAFAAFAVGQPGVITAGGVNNALSITPEALEDRAHTVAGKDVRILFDNDAAGEATQWKVAKQLLDDGAKRVAVVELPEGADLEDWLNEHHSKDEARARLNTLLTSASWLSAKQVDAQLKESDKKRKARETRVQSERIMVAGDPWPRLVVTTWDGKRIGLAVFKPLEDPERVVPGYGDQQVDWDSLTRGWTQLDTWSHGGRTYLPDISEDTVAKLKRRTLILPPPPAETGLWSSEELWDRMKHYQRRWVLFPGSAYPVTTAYGLMTWRLEDAEFQFVPYLRFYGPPGSGKGRALEVMAQLVWRGLAQHPTNQNLHRIVDHFGDVSLILDEFHLNADYTRQNRQLIDMLCLGNSRSYGEVARVSDTKSGTVMRSYRLFGPKVLAGYGHDEDEALTRRTVAVHMAPDLDLPENMDLLALPDEFYQEGAEIRAQLLAWRGRKLGLGLPDPRDPRFRELARRAGRQVAQVFLPLVAMVPAGRPEDLEAVYQYAEGRKADVAQSRAHSSDAYYVQALTDLVGRGQAHELGGVYYVTAGEVAAEIGNQTTAEGAGWALRRLGLESERQRLPGDKNARRYYPLPRQSAALMDLTSRYGLEWPPTQSTTADPTAGL